MNRALCPKDQKICPCNKVSCMRASRYEYGAEIMVDSVIAAPGLELWRVFVGIHTLRNIWVLIDIWCQGDKRVL